MRARPYSVARAHHGSSGQVFGTILEESRGGGGGARCDGGMRRREIRNPPSSDIHGELSPMVSMCAHALTQV